MNSSCSSNLIRVSITSRPTEKSGGETIKTALLNIRSLGNKSFLINDFITSHNLDFLFLTETWLDNKNSAAIVIEATPPNFNTFTVSRDGKKGGGVAALYRNKFQCKQVHFGEFASFEYLSFLLKHPQQILFLTVYRPPKYCSSFLDDLTDLLSLTSTEYDCLVMAGDFNVHFDNTLDKYAKELTVILETFGLSQHVQGPTHNRGHTLDLVITKGLDISSVSVVDVALSDHFSVFFHISTAPQTPANGAIVKKRHFNEKTTEMFIKAISLSPPSMSTCVDQLLNDFNSNITDIINTIAPIKDKLMSPKPAAPWRNAAPVRAQKSECRKAERKWRKSGLHIHHDIYKESLHNYNLVLKNARQSHFSDMIKNNSNNARVLFTVVDRMISLPVSTPPEHLSASKCDEFAEFFRDKIETIRSSINQSAQNILTFYPTEMTVVQMSEFKTIDLLTLEKIVSQLSVSTCCLDPLPTKFFKQCFNHISKYLLQIVNCSISSGIFPQGLKTAVIKPLLKKSTLDSSVLNNFRPISNLPFIGKVIEKVVYQQLSSFLNSNDRFDIFQSGFRPNHSTETALIKVVNDIRLNSDTGRMSVLVLLDLSAAFDTVDHSILIERLEQLIGLSDTVLCWFKSYLQDRDYFVSIGNFFSQKVNMRCGVPQGSILGPLLFNLYMLPLGKLLRDNNVSYHNYADDTQIYIALSPTDYSPIDSLYHCISLINDWMSQNFLQLNKNKTEVVVFGPNKDERIKVSTYLKSLSLQTTNHARNLGVILDADLHFENQINSLTKSAYYHLKNIARIRGLLSKPDLEKLVHAFISSRLDYCNGLYTGLPKKTIQKLQRVQNAAARVLTKTKKYDHITPVLRSLHWLPLSERVEFKINLLVYKSLNGLGPKYLLNLLTPYQPSRTLRSSGKGLLTVYNSKTKHGKASFRYCAAHSWNKLPETLRYAPNVATFKSRLKTFLFCQAYEI